MLSTTREKFSYVDQSLEFSHFPVFDFFKIRKTVLFLSYCRFFEEHGFVQQSLAKLLVENGVNVIWLDGTSWMPRHPQIYYHSPMLTVKQLFCLPARRFRWIEKINILFQKKILSHLIKQHGEPVIWIQAGLDEQLCETLPYIDFYSTFDDPLRHKNEGALLKKAKVVVCQNSYAYEHIEHSNKVLLPPPFEVSQSSFTKDAFINFPSSFPVKRLGYIGSLFSHDFDWNFLSEVIKKLPPHLGFFAMGRTDDQGRDWIKKLSQFSNFYYHHWIPRTHIRSAWKAIDINAMIYKKCPTQLGAFPVKILEALYFGKPSVATDVSKTKDISEFAKIVSSPDEFILQSLELLKKPINPYHYPYLKEKMDPTFHLKSCVLHYLA